MQGFALTRIGMPAPISANKLKSGGWGKKAVTDTKQYKAWKDEAAYALRRVAPINGRVTILYRVGTCATAILDVGNVEKAYTDALVSAGIIAGDSRRHVAAVASEWVDGGAECEALVMPAQSFAALLKIEGQIT